MNPQILEKQTQDSKQRLAELVQTGLSDGALHIELLPVKGYEQVVKVTDKKAQLTAIIAIHDTTMGPALGGVRVHPYATFSDALEDVLRLAKGMTYKSAISEVGYGGGKTVVIANPKTQKTPSMIGCRSARKTRKELAASLQKDFSFLKIPK